ncbi:MAG: glycosyltransferase family 1 protein [Desulfovibrionaceae bacterium]
MHIAFFLPPVKRPAGGVAVLVKLASLLHRAGLPVRLVPRQEGWLPPDAELAPLTPWDELSLTPNDVWVAPEGWANALLPGLKAQARCLVYCQNWAYLFSSLPPGLRLGELPVEYLAVSHPVARFIEESLGARPAVLRPGLDLETFHPPESKPGPPWRVAYMPRKNKALAGQIRAVLEARGRVGDVSWLEIEGRGPAGVADLLRSAHVFLAAGFPEGCPLPPLEAMACGCLVTGFTGFGGLDYMRQAPGAAWTPPHPLRPVPWDGNGLWSADNDVLDAALNLERALGWWAEAAGELAPALDAAQQTARAYSMQAHQETALDIFRSLAHN